MNILKVSPKGANMDTWEQHYMFKSYEAGLAMYEEYTNRICTE
jgi:hypothetical protein